MIQKIAHIISWIFLPLFIPIYGLIISLYVPSEEKIISNPSLYELPADLKNQLLVLFIIFGVIAPGISFILLYKRQIISTVEMDNRKDRMIPLFIIFTYCIILYFLFFLKAPNNILPIYIYALPLTGAIIALVFLLINFWTKISLHAAGAGIFTGYLYAFFAHQLIIEYRLILIAFVVSGIIMSSRLFLNKHTPLQVYLGWSIAFIIAFVCNFHYPFNLA